MIGLITGNKLFIKGDKRRRFTQLGCSARAPKYGEN